MVAKIGQQHHAAQHYEWKFVTSDLENKFFSFLPISYSVKSSSDGGSQCYAQSNKHFQSTLLRIKFSQFDPHLLAITAPVLSGNSSITNVKEAVAKVDVPIASKIRTRNAKITNICTLSISSKMLKTYSYRRIRLSDNYPKSIEQLPATNVPASTQNRGPSTQCGGGGALFFDKSVCSYW